MPQLYPGKYIFLEDSCFLEEGFWLCLESVSRRKQNQPLFFILDDSITRLQSGPSDSEEIFIKKCYVKLLEQNGTIISVKTQGYLDGSRLQEFFREKTGEKIAVIQKETIYHAFSFLEKDGVPLYRFDTDRLEPWKKVEISYEKPFYLENDSQYINVIDTDKLEVVFSPKYGYLKLDKKHPHSGGEGSCYSTYRNLFCKIYNQKHLTYTNMKKIQAMLEMDIYNPYVIWPLDLLYYNNNFVGYVMNKVPQTPNLTELRDNDFFLDGSDTQMSLAERTLVCLHLLEIIQYLHEKNIIIGDLKDENVLVNRQLDVFIIDSGSFQVGDYACDVFTKGWTDKNYTKGDLYEHLRTKEDEYYPINRMLFELLITKSPYYSSSNTELDDEDNINEKSFDYYLELSQYQMENLKEARNVLWAKLTSGVRQSFYYYFSNPQKRVITYVKDWIPKMKELYTRCIEKNF